MYNKRLKDRHLKLKSLRNDEEDGLFVNELPSDDEWLSGENDDGDMRKKMMDLMLIFLKLQINSREKKLNQEIAREKVLQKQVKWQVGNKFSFYFSKVS